MSYTVNFIYLLAFLWGAIFWLFIVFSYPKIMSSLEVFFRKFMPDFSSQVLSWILTLSLCFILFGSFRMFKIFVPDNDWRQVSKFYFLGVLFSGCTLQLIKYLVERQKK